MIKCIYRIKESIILPIIVCCAVLLAACTNQNSDYIVYQNNASFNNKYTVETRVYKGQMPELYINDELITDNLYGIEYTPYVNNEGQYAYAFYNESTSSSSIIINGQSIANGQFCRVLYMDNSDVYYAMWNSDDESSYVYSYDINNEEVNLMSVLENEYVSSLEYVSKEHFVAEVWNSIDNTNYAKDFLVIGGAIQERQYEGITETNESFIIHKNGEIFIDAVEGNENGKYLYNALKQYYSEQFGEPFSLANDFSGRISWNEAYRLSGIIELYNKTSNEIFLKDIQQACDNLLNVVNKKIGVTGDETTPELWATRKYSIDKITPRTDMVNNACILYPLLKAVNQGLLTKENSEEVIKKAEFAYDYFNEEFGYNEGHYYWPKGSSFYLDGVFLPWNQQNMFGVALIELYKATGDGRYYERCREMMETFKEEWIYIDNRLTWNYWPNAFYDGWTEKDDVSINTPEQGQSYESMKYGEDSSHSGINAKFIKEYYDTFGDGLVKVSDIEKIKNTLDGICTDDGFYEYIMGQGYSEPSYLNSVSSWWVEYDSDKLNAQLSGYGNSMYPDFDWQKIYQWAYLYDENEEIDLKIERYSINGKQADKVKSITMDNPEDVFKYFSEIYEDSK